ncbi:MAG: hypothetical protein RDU83_09540 [bacterium]|nr:hypothetical protein [bacterium]
MSRRQVLVIGLDAAEPDLVFDRCRDELPVLRSRMWHREFSAFSPSHRPMGC